MNQVKMLQTSSDRINNLSQQSYMLLDVSNLPRGARPLSFMRNLQNGNLENYEVASTTESLSRNVADSNINLKVTNWRESNARACRTPNGPALFDRRLSDAHNHAQAAEMIAKRPRRSHSHISSKLGMKFGHQFGDARDFPTKPMPKLQRHYSDVGQNLIPRPAVVLQRQHSDLGHALVNQHPGNLQRQVSDASSRFTPEHNASSLYLIPTNQASTSPENLLLHMPVEGLHSIPAVLAERMSHEELQDIAVANAKKIREHESQRIEKEQKRKIIIENSRYARQKRPNLADIERQMHENQGQTHEGPHSADSENSSLQVTVADSPEANSDTTGSNTNMGDGLTSNNFMSSKVIERKEHGCEQIKPTSGSTGDDKVKDEHMKIDPHSNDISLPGNDTVIANGVNEKALDDREELVVDDNTENGGCCRRGFKGWCKKYFWEGQSLSKATQSQLDKHKDSAKQLPLHRRLLVNHRRLVGLLLPALIYHLCWWGVAIKYKLWGLFAEKYYMTLTMVGGSIIAGMTSEGGGAIAFPVMTLAFAISPMVARDFSLMIQSCGMTAAAFTIFFMGIKLEWHSLVLCSLGGAVGIIFGFHFVDPNLTPAQKKMGFVSIWFSFAFSLFLLNRYHKRRTFKSIPEFNAWKMGVLLLSGLIGGIFSSFAGSGLDICSFSMLTLLFRVSEKVATPTSVVLMAGNTVVGFYWRGVMSDWPISQDAWEFLAVCVPVVVLGAPVGSVLGSHFHRQVLAAFVYIIDIAALVGAFVIVPLTPDLIGASVGIIVAGFLFFMMITFVGHKTLKGITEREKKVEKPAKETFRSFITDDKLFDNPSFMTAEKDSTNV